MGGSYDNLSTLGLRLPQFEAKSIVHGEHRTPDLSIKELI